MTTIGIECESIENDTWGIARIINKTLEELAHRRDIGQDFRIHLYFKSKIPAYEYLKDPRFITTMVRIPWLPTSFSLYYYILLPLRAWWDGVQVLYFPNYMLPLIWFGKSVVLLAHDVYYEAHNKDIPFRYRLAYSIFSTWAARRATRVMAMSEFGRKELARIYRIDPGRITVNYLAVDKQKDTALGLPHKRPYFLFIGQAFPRRHLKEALLAFEKVAQENEDIDMLIVGVDRYQPPILKELMTSIAARLGKERIFHLARKNDRELVELIKSSRAVIYVSSRESFGLPPLEALAYHSIPVVADNELSRELFGNAAVFAPLPVDISVLAHALKTAAYDEVARQEILRQADVVVARFSWKEHTERLFGILSEVAGS